MAKNAGHKDTYPRVLQDSLRLYFRFPETSLTFPSATRKILLSPRLKRTFEIWPKVVRG